MKIVFKTSKGLTKEKKTWVQISSLKHTIEVSPVSPDLAKFRLAT